MSQLIELARQAKALNRNLPRDVQQAIAYMCYGHNELAHAMADWAANHGVDSREDLEDKLAEFGISPVHTHTWGSEIELLSEHFLS